VPKMKTRKTASSRFRLTASGKLKHSRSGRRHLLAKKSSKRKRQLRNSTTVHTSQENMYKRMLGLSTK